MPYVGEIRVFAGNFAPAGWLLCQGQQLSISEFETLFQLIGTTYGGDGQQTFNLPDLQSRVPVHMGTGPTGTTYVIGEKAGVESVTLTIQQMPVHNHALLASTTTGTAGNPRGNVIAAPPGTAAFVRATPNQLLAPSALNPAGGSQPHENMQPSVAVNFIINLYGVFPST
jgi:microcystin-dependent protein